MSIDTSNKKTSLNEDAAIYNKDRELSEKELWRSMNPEEKKVQFREYYMIPLIAGIAVCFIIGYLAYDAISNHRDVVYMATILNDSLDADRLGEFNHNLLEYLGYNGKKEEVRFEDNYLLSGGTSSDVLATTESITSYIYAKKLDAMIADSASFDHYATLGCFVDLKEALTPEQYEKYSAYLYYPELEKTDSPVPDTLNNRPDETYACGIILSDSEVYKSLKPAQTKPILGFIITSGNLEASIKILEYLYP